ncbi:MAG TPA: MBL fold metallo-hydrolase [Dehalococcoidia bacterium]
MEVANGVYAVDLPIPFPVRQVTVYLVLGNDGVTLIDSGFASEECFSLIERALQQAGAAPVDVSRVIITHYHPDHSGLAGRFQTIAGAQVIAHEADLDHLDRLHRRSPAGGDALYQRLSRLLGRDDRPPWEPLEDRRTAVPQAIHADVMARGGEIIDLGTRQLELVWTPGHTDGHLCVLDREAGILFTGDHVLQRITPHVGLAGNSDPNPLARFEESLRLVERLAPRLGLPAHGPIIRDPVERVHEILHHHRARRQAVLDALGSGERHALAVSDVIFARRVGDPQQRWMALNETLAHLAALEAEGAVVRRAGEDGVDYYRAVA